ncbi:hypothetical protein [Bacillus sp. FJAT-45037]|uniref:hypothetical protein n=1 Tax=Bacillus sp. FJAT-45037 TaxID=2011007 RepID=UPI000C238303|nr:hypothetical protein [Bacillus sp. FJAT-45037]
MNKFFVITLSFVLMFSGISIHLSNDVFASSKDNEFSFSYEILNEEEAYFSEDFTESLEEIGIEHNYSHEVEYASEEYIKIKITNLENGEIEYLEIFNEDNEMVLYAHNKDGIQKIEDIDGEVYVDGEQYTESIDEAINNSTASSPEDTFVTMSSLGPWDLNRSITGNRSISVATVSAVYGILITIVTNAKFDNVTGTIISIVWTIGTTLVSMNLKRVYYRQFQYKSRTSFCSRKYNTYFYRHSNFTGQIGGVTERIFRIC